MNIWSLTEPLDLADATEHFVELGRTVIHYYRVDGPANGPPVILTHGGGPGHTGWNNFLYNGRALSKRHSCYFIDLPQFGLSSKDPISGPMFSWHAERLFEFLDAVDIARAHFVNQSLGGSAVVALAAKHPHRVASLTTLSSQPVHGGVMAPIALSTKRAATILRDYFCADGGPSLEKMREIIAVYEFVDDTKITDLNVRVRYEASLDPAFARIAGTPGAAGEWESLMHLFRAVVSPALILSGANDWFGGPDVALLMLNQFADARLHVVRNAGHHLQTECPEEFNRVVLSFLEACDAAEQSRSKK